MTFDRTMTAGRWAVIVLLVLGIADAVTPAGIVLLPVLGVAPLLSASDGPPVMTVRVGVGAVILAVVSGYSNDIEWNVRHAIGVVSTAIISVIAWRLAVFRSRREVALRDSRTHVERSLRLASAMAAGDIGEWWFDVDTGVTRWDESSRGLLAVSDGSGEGSFAEMIGRLEERQRIERDLLVSTSTGMGFRGDYRVRHDDGSLHWVELVGEPLVNGRVEGVVGLVRSTDQQHHEVEELDRLLAFESSARQGIEFLDCVQEVLGRSLDIEEILDHVTTSIVPQLGDWSAIALTMDRTERNTLFIAHHADPDEDRRLQEHLVSIAAPGAPWPFAPLGRVPLTGESQASVVHASRDTELSEAAMQLRDRFDVDHLISVPIVGALGVLGAIHLMRGSRREPPTQMDLDLAEELASRVGAALNTAVLYDRLLTSRSLLQGLQTVTGELASAATFGDVSRAILGEGRRAMDAVGAALFLLDRAGQLHLEAAEGVPAGREAHELAECAVRECQTIDGELDGEGLTAVAVPLSRPDGAVGTLEFVFSPERVLSDGEISALTALGSRTAAAVERASTYDRDHDVALVLQRRLLPDVSHTPPWLEVAAHYEPATGGPIGGDWYQMVELGEGRVAAVVGDAVGHGLVSAAAMGQLRASVTTALTATHDPASALAMVDRFADLSADTIGASIVVALIAHSGTVTIASAGHPPAVLIPRAGPLRVLEDGRRPLLGYGRGAPAMSEFAYLGLGDAIVLYSDGLIERRRRSFDEGLRELVAILGDLRDLEVDVVARELIERMSVHADAEDDVAVMVVRRAEPT